MSDTLTPPMETIQTRMPDASLEALDVSELERSPFRKLWTRRECEALEQEGLLMRHYELIFGEIIFMEQSLPHRISVMLVIFWMGRMFGNEHMQIMASISASPADAKINAPEPDIVALNVALASLPGNEPMPADIALIVEVSDSTLRFDLRVKALLYARAGIGEY